VRASRDSNEVYLALGVEHLREARHFADRGRDAFFDEDDPLVFVAVESELRKAFESLNRLGQPFWTANPLLPRDRVGEIRQILTHDYAEVDRELVWSVVRDEVPILLRRLARAKQPKSR
jgi:uncharacterized protein with HEPN domain